MIEKKKLIEEIMLDFQAVRRKMMGESHRFFGEKKITFAQGQVIRLVKNNEGIGIKEIAENLGISSSAATQLVDQLSQNGFLVKESNPTDRRALRIKLSSKCKEEFQKLRANVLERLTGLFESFTPEELKSYMTLNKKIVANILKERSDEQISKIS